MIRRPPRSTRTDTLFPYTTLFRSDGFTDELAKGVVDLALERAELAAAGLHPFMLFGEINATPERSHVYFSIEDMERTQPVHPAPPMGMCFFHVRPELLRPEGRRVGIRGVPSFSARGLPVPSQ